MATIRIRTHDPESVSFFTAKLADCGFDIEFAAPGQKVRGEVDLELTVNYSKRSSRKQLRDGTSKATARVEWTTPYHLDAPELGEESHRLRENSADDRQLARILAGGSNRKNMFVIGVRETTETDQDQPSEELPAVAPRLAAVAPVQSSRPSSVSRTLNRPRARRQSFLQRNAALAAAFILATSVILFYLSVFGKTVARRPAIEPNLLSAPAAQAIPVSAPTVPTATVLEGNSAGSEEVAAKPSAHKRRAHSRVQSRANDAVSDVAEPEVTVRHFPPE